MKKGRKMQGWQGVSLWSAALALMASGLAGPAGAQALPGHSVDFDPATGRCRIVLEPAGTTGDAPPRLFVTSDLLKPSFAFGLDGKDIAEAVVIRANTRAPLMARQGLDAAALQADPFWAAMTKTAEGKDSLYLTVKDAKGRYSSARYDGLHAADVWRLAALACRATGLDVTPQTPVEFRDVEAALSLTEADRVQLRKVLAATYGEAGTDVGTDAGFTVTDRRFIVQYNQEHGHPSGEYLWPEALKDMLAMLLPVVATAPLADEEVADSFGDWVQLRSKGGATCRIATSASEVVGIDPGLVPALRMSFAVDRADSGGRLAFELVTPNPFRTDAPIVARVGDEAFALLIEPTSGAVIPKPLADGSLSNALMVALRRGKLVAIQGGSASGAPAGVAFSAIGFSAAFSAMAKDCNRSGVMAWIE
jgi:hypothetical protein